MVLTKKIVIKVSQLTKSLCTYHKNRSFKKKCPKLPKVYGSYHKIRNFKKKCPKLPRVYGTYHTYKAGNIEPDRITNNIGSPVARLDGVVRHVLTRALHVVIKVKVKVVDHLTYISPSCPTAGALVKVHTSTKKIKK